MANFGVRAAQNKETVLCSLTSLADNFRKSMYRLLEQQELLNKLFWVGHH